MNVNCVFGILNASTNESINKGVKFLNKLWCCVGGRVHQGNEVLSTQLIILNCTILTV